MTILADWQIRKLALAGMIEPFVDRQVKEIATKGIISYGLGSFGYDIRVADEFRIFTPSTDELTVVDPKAMDERAMVPYQGDVCVIPPNSFVLARSVEYFRVPRNVLCICLGKSTYARIGVIVNCTPFEPEWEGHVTIEISNTTPLPCKIYANEGIAQVLFFEGAEPNVSYADRKGKYQSQVGITLARVDMSPATSNRVGVLDWDKAKRDFDAVYQIYKKYQGSSGANTKLALCVVFEPLLQRYDAGERSQDLYDAMMNVE